jgi:glycosyltransferase involved in cell wall biosynthesis
VGLNAIYLDPGRTGGPETYLRGLAPALASEFPDVRFTIATTRSGAAALTRDGFGDFAEVLALPADVPQRVRRLYAEQVLLPRLAKREGWDLVHSLSSVAPLRTGVPSVVTLHDVIFFTHDTLRWSSGVALRRLVALSARRADGLITVSEASRDEICKVLGLDPASFVVAYHGAGRLPDLEPTGEADTIARYGLEGKRVVLAVGAKRPHKNQMLLVRALPSLDEDMVLVLAGAEEAYDEELRAAARSLGVSDRVRFPGYVPDADLEALWRLCGCMAFPSLAEGFGLPLVEAFQRGVPVAASDIPVMREVGSDAAVYFDPHDPADAARAIREAFGNEKLAAAGPPRAAQFSWPEAARKTFEPYERAVSRTGTPPGAG